MVKDKAQNRTLQYQQTLVSFGTRSWTTSTVVCVARCHGCACVRAPEDGAPAAARSTVSCARPAGDCVPPFIGHSCRSIINRNCIYCLILRVPSLRRPILDLKVFVLACSPCSCIVPPCTPFIYLNPQVLHHSQALPATTPIINFYQFRFHIF